MSIEEQLQRRLYSLLAAGEEPVHPWAVCLGAWQHVVRSVLRDAGMIEDGHGGYVATQATVAWVDAQDRRERRVDR